MILLLLLSIAFAAPWYVGQTVNQISIVSPSGSEGELSSLLGHPLGEPLDLRLVRQDLQTLYLAGDFDSVIVRVHPIMGEGVHLQYNIKHAPKINSVRFVGAPAELRNILTNRLNLNLGQVFYPEEEVFKLEESIRTIGAKEGWTDLQVRIDVLRNKEERVNLTLNIEPGEMQKLSGITLVDLPQEVFIETQLLLLRKGVWRGARVSIKELSQLKDEIRSRLVRKGWIQARVNLPLVEVSAKRSQLTIRVEPGPLHLFEADSPLPKGEKLLALLDIYPGDRITVGDEDRFEQKVYLWMQRNGFVGAPPKVSIQRTPKKITIDIEIQKYKTVRLRKFDIDGAFVLREADILASVYEEIPELKKGIYTAESWEDAVQVIEELYRGQGFLEARIEALPIEEVEKKNRVDLYAKLRIYEGRQLRYGVVSSTGGLSDIMENISLELSGNYRPSQIESIEQEILLAHQDRGYLNSNVRTVRNIDTVRNLIDCTFTIETGPQIRLRALILRGNQRTKRELLDDSISLQVGAPIRPSMIEKSKSQLYGLDLFRQIQFEQFDAGEGIEDMVIRLDEHPNIFMTIAGALTTDEGAQLRFSSGHRNLFGLGHKLSFVGQAGFGWDGEGWLLDRYAPDWRTSIRYTAPRLPIKQGSFFTELVLREQIQESNFRLYRSGLKAGVSLSINQNWRMLVEYGIQRVDIDDYDQGLLITGDPWIEILSTQNHRWSSGGTLSTIWDGRDSPFNPKRGGFASLGLSATDGLLGMASSVQALSNWSYNWDLQQFRFRISNSNGLAVMRNEETLPFDQRFFLGGANSLRGFVRNSVGPTNYVLRPEIAFPTQIGPAIESSSLRENPAQWISTGGDLFYTLSLEALYPLAPFELDHISIITFCDLGYLGFQNETLQTDSILEGDESIRYGVGLGLRWLTSVGPISLDLGINPAYLSERGESLFTPYFSFGNN